MKKANGSVQPSKKPFVPKACNSPASITTPLISMGQSITEKHFNQDMYPSFLANICNESQEHPSFCLVVAILYP